MNTTPVGNRMHIAIFGRRNTGKSTLINAITNQDIAVVSEVAGTTTDPVYKTMELLPIGPVVIIDTAGLDDVGDLGNLRIEKTYDVLRKTDFAIVVISSIDFISNWDKKFVNEIKARQIPVAVVLNKCDLKSYTIEELESIKSELNCPVIAISAENKIGIDELKKIIFENAKYDDSKLSIVSDLIKPRDLVVLVTPIDKAAPKGRMILPQQQTIREVIESDAICIVTKENELKETLKSLNKKPALVITDSQAFLKVSQDTPEDIPLTSFSILFARYKGELLEMVKGIKKIKELKPNSRVLIVEGCTHHRQEGDIGSVKIPVWVRQLVGADVSFEFASGTHYPKNIENFDAIIHCGGCMLNKQEMLYRINLAKEKNVAITNYGMLIAYVNGVLDRALKPFPVISKVLEDLTP